MKRIISFVVVIVLLLPTICMGQTIPDTSLYFSFYGNVDIQKHTIGRHWLDLRDYYHEIGRDSLKKLGFDPNRGPLAYPLSDSVLYRAFKLYPNYKIFCLEGKDAFKYCEIVGVVMRKSYAGTFGKMITDLDVDLSGLCLIYDKYMYSDSELQEIPKDSLAKESVFSIYSTGVEQYFLQHRDMLAKSVVFFDPIDTTTSDEELALEIRRSRDQEAFSFTHNGHEFVIHRISENLDWPGGLTTIHFTDSGHKERLVHVTVRNVFKIRDRLILYAVGTKPHTGWRIIYLYEIHQDGLEVIFKDSSQST